MHTTAATGPDVTATTPIQHKLAERGLAPGEHLLDAGYPSADNLTRLGAHLAPRPPAQRRPTRIALCTAHGLTTA